MFIESVKEGLRLTHRNPQLVYIRIFLVFIKITVFFIIVGVSALWAAASIGMDLSNAGGLMHSLLKDPFVILSKYLVILLVISAAFIIYLTFSSLLHFYVLGGTLGVLNNSAADMRYSFSFSSFLSESWKNFFRLIWLVSITFVSFFFVVAVFIILSSIVFNIRTPISEAGPFINDFIGSFAAISVIVFGSIISFASFVFAVYSMAVSVIEGSGAMKTIRKSYSFLKNRPSAFVYYMVLFLGMITVNVLIFMLQVPLGMVSDGRLVIILMTAIVGIAVQSYVTVLLWSCLIVFYIKASDLRTYQPAYDI